MNYIIVATKCNKLTPLLKLCQSENVTQRNGMQAIFKRSEFPIELQWLILFVVRFHTQSQDLSQSTNFQVRHKDLGKVSQHGVVPGCFSCGLSSGYQWIFSHLCDHYIHITNTKCSQNFQYHKQPCGNYAFRILLLIFIFLKWNKIFLSVHRHLDS